MKKTLLAVTMLSALSLSSVATAAFVEGNDFTDNLTFSGTIKNDNPIWAWEVPMSNTQAVQGWDALVINGVITGQNTEYAFASKSKMTLIHGYMKTASVTGGAGITPVITVGNTDSAITILDGSEQEVTVIATGSNASSNAVINGTMKLKAQAFLGGAINDGKNSRYFGSSKAHSVLASNRPDFTDTYPVISAATGQTYSQSELEFADQTNIKLSGAYLAEISDYKLAFPSDTIPATWSAIIPVTVTLK